MPSRYKPGDIAYIVENALTVREVKVLKVSGEFVTLQFTNVRGGVRLRESRLYPDLESAKAALPKPKVPNHWEMEIALQGRKPGSH